MLFPFEVIVKDGKKHFYENQAQMLARLEQFREIHRQLGIVEITRDVTKVHQTQSDEALVFTRDVAKDAQGREITSWKTSYFVKRTKNGVKLVKADASDQNRAMTELGFPLYKTRSVSFS